MIVFWSVVPLHFLLGYNERCKEFNKKQTFPEYYFEMMRPLQYLCGASKKSKNLFKTFKDKFQVISHYYQSDIKYSEERLKCRLKTEYFHTEPESSQINGCI